jgi:hypothetical protein
MDDHQLFVFPFQEFVREPIALEYMGGFRRKKLGKVHAHTPCQV